MSHPKYYLIGAVFLLSTVSLSAQIAEADSLQGREKVEFIIDNFYEIYSKDFDEGIRLTKTAQELSRENGWEFLEGMSFTYNGVAKFLRGKHDSAYKSFLAADRIFERINSDTGKAALYNEMAIFYSKRGDVEKAFETLDKAEAAARRSNNLTQLGTTYSHRSLFVRRQGDLDSAKALTQALLDIRKQENDSVGLGYVYLDLAEYSSGDGDRDLAMAYVDTAEIIRTGIKDEQGLAVVEVFRGEIEMGSNNVQQAIPRFQKTIDMASAVGYTDLIRFTYDQLQNAYVQLGEYEKAYEALKENRAFNDSLFNIEKVKAINELRTQYETEKKDREIAELSERTALQEAENARNTLLIVVLASLVVLLVLAFVIYRQNQLAKARAMENEREIEIRKAQTKAVLESQEKERKRFAADLHDGMGQLVSALSLNLQSLRKEVPDDASILLNNSKTILNDILAEIRNTAFDLMPPALTKAGLVSALQDLVDRLNAAGTIEFNVEADTQIQLNQNEEIAVFRVVQEWVSNIIKYGTATEVTVKLADADGSLELTIIDNGDGFDPMALEHGKGNGWRNINARLNLLDSKPMVFSHPEEKSTKLYASIPIRKRMRA